MSACFRAVAVLLIPLMLVANGCTVAGLITGRAADHRNATLSPVPLDSLDTAVDKHDLLQVVTRDSTQYEGFITHFYADSTIHLAIDRSSSFTLDRDELAHVYRMELGDQGAKYALVGFVIDVTVLAVVTVLAIQAAQDDRDEINDILNGDD